MTFCRIEENQRRRETRANRLTLLQNDLDPSRFPSRNPAATVHPRNRSQVVHSHFDLLEILHRRGSQKRIERFERKTLRVEFCKIESERGEGRRGEFGELIVDRFERAGFALADVEVLESSAVGECRLHGEFAIVEGEVGEIGESENDSGGKLSEMMPRIGFDVVDVGDSERLERRGGGGEDGVEQGSGKITIRQIEVSKSHL